jgi:hypothetical protein
MHEQVVFILILIKTCIVVVNQLGIYFYTAHEEVLKIFDYVYLMSFYRRIFEKKQKLFEEFRTMSQADR